MIISASLLPDRALAEIPLAEQLGVSRPTLREALRQLEGEGLLATTGAACESLADDADRHTRDGKLTLAMRDNRAFHQAIDDLPTAPQARMRSIGCGTES